MKDSEASKEPTGTGLLTPPSISLPKGGGAIRGIGEKFAANPVSGTGSMTVPLPTSPGRSGFGPELSLAYNSGSGNGPFGVGWSLATPSIARKTDKGLPRYLDSEDSDVFVLSGAEDLVPVLSSGARFEDVTTFPGYTVHRYRPRVEGLFARIERWTERASGDVHWRSISRDNVTSIYGKTLESRIADPADVRRVFRWLLSETYDDRGNAVVYFYAAENDVHVDLARASERQRTRAGTRYLKRVKYGNRVSRLIQPDLAAAEWLFEVVFDYDEGHRVELPLDPTLTAAAQHRYVRAAAGPNLEWDAANRAWSTRPDPFSSYRPGFELRTHRRCSRVLMFHRFAELGAVPYLVRSTEFNYADLDYETLESQRRVQASDELAHEGSTRIGSFIQSVTQWGYVRDDRAATDSGGATYVTYLAKPMPPVNLRYSKARIDDAVHELDSSSLENLPNEIGSPYRMVDLDGEGLPGILTEQAGEWFYKPNRGESGFGPMRTVAAKPFASSLASGRQRLVDLAGDGSLDVVTMGGPMPGFQERSETDGWGRFTPFESRPEIDWDQPNLRMVDLTGDGLADVMITENDVITWHESLAETGYGASKRVPKDLDEERGPRVVFADGTQSIHLADMSGDGLVDLVRVRNGGVCYWPNLGYGRFGAKVLMDNAPWFESPDLFQQGRVQLADIDGSGTTDIIYLGREGALLHFNLSGNGWSEPRSLPTFPHVDDDARVQTADLKGNGTACLVWSSSLAADAQSPVRYIDLMSGQKPHLLIATENNLGAETRVHYAPSTKFYLEDRAAGRPWITKIPFPVHVVERVETYDHISRNRFVTRYAYHHGHFDGREREFRGFGMVEQWDTEEMAALVQSDAFPVGDNVDAASHVPPVLTKTWFHTGIYMGREHVSNFFAGLGDAHGLGEYYREPGLDDAQAREQLLPDTVLPEGLSIDEEHEACRVLRGAMLRQEVYALDGSEQEPHPYTVVEQTMGVRVLQRQESNRHGVFLSHLREALTYHYERDPSDPRVGHSLTLEVDGFGNVRKEAAVGYGRRQPDPTLPHDQDRAKQTERLVTYNETEFTNAVDEAHACRAPVPCEVRGYELTGYVPTGSVGRFRPADFAGPDPSDPDRRVLVADEMIAYEAEPTVGKQGRLIEQTRVLFRPNDFGEAQGDAEALLPLGSIESRALTGESYKLAFTPGLLARLFEGVREPSENLLGSNPANVLGGQGADQGGYVDLDDDGRWWVPSGRTFFSPSASDGSALEHQYSKNHFFPALRYRGPFGRTTTVTLDDYDLLTVETSDALGNIVTAGERKPDGSIVISNDYRVLGPTLVMGPNGNRSAVRFDALGRSVGSAVMGKAAPQVIEGDSFDGFRADLTESEVLEHLGDPLASPGAILKHATNRQVYNLFAYMRTKGDPQPQPVAVYTLARETHAADLAAGVQAKLQHGFAYTDGFGRTIQQKGQAEPGPAPKRDATGGIVLGPDGVPEMTVHAVSSRWVGSGWTIFNNKGKPVRQYEPFFSDTHAFEFGVRVGVSPTLFYDSLSRPIATLYPNDTYEKVVFTPWRQVSYDVNDTVAARGTETGDPRTDADVRGYVEEFFASQPTNWQTWHEARAGGLLGAAEQAAATKAAVHASTPTSVALDALGRTFLTVTHNRFERDGSVFVEHAPARVELDIEANQRALRDPADQDHSPPGRLVMKYDYNMLGGRIRQSSMEAGERWILNDVSGAPVRTWNSRRHDGRTEYDPLRRPLRSFVVVPTAAEPNRELLTERRVYGEQHPEAEQRNLRGALYLHLDQAGVATTDSLSFKGNLLGGSRRLAREYKETLDWTATDADHAALPIMATTKLDLLALDSALIPLLEAETYTKRTAFDALGRTVTTTMPDGSVVRPSYNEANLLESLEANLRGEVVGGDVVWTPFVADINYDAKGQRTLIEYASGKAPGQQGVTTNYTYDRKSFRLKSMVTRRDAATFQQDCPSAQTPGWPGCELQSLHYTCDPAGNITTIRDDAQQRIYFKQKRVEPDADYTYDALYRLIEATGREHLGQVGANPIPHGPSDGLRMQCPHPNDGLAMARYVEQYVYDAVGNIQTMKHHGAAGGPVWVRGYTYAEASQLETLQQSNRLSHTSVGAGNPSTEHYQYDDHGNLVRMPHLAFANPVRNMHWDTKGRLRRLQLSSGRTAYYTYSASGQRLRKVLESSNGAKESERVYLGQYEVCHYHTGVDAGLVHETLHISVAKGRVALVENRNKALPNGTKQMVRYQLDNHLGSAILELSELAHISSYEEYTPFGSTCHQAVRTRSSTHKRYRFTGKERDAESGLYYHGARYYAPWLSRWTSTDPAGFVDGFNLYAYVQLRPTTMVDLDGRQGSPKDQSKPKRKSKPLKEARIGEIRKYAARKATTGLDGKRSEQEHVKSKSINEGLQADYEKKHYRKSPGLFVPNDLAREKTPLDNRLGRELKAANSAGGKIPDDLLKQVTAEGASVRTIEARERAITKRRAAGVAVDDLLEVTDDKVRVTAALQEHAGPNTSASTMSKHGADLDLGKIEAGFDANFDSPAPSPKPKTGGGFSRIAESKTIGRLANSKAVKVLAVVAPILASGVAKATPGLGLLVGAADVASEAAGGSGRRAALSAIGASEIPFVSQTADVGVAVADAGWAAKEVIDPDQKAEQWAHENLQWLGF